MLKKEKKRILLVELFLDKKKRYKQRKMIQHLDIRKSVKVQQKAKEKAQKLTDISFLLQPKNNSFSHLNCALILYEKTASELKPYLKALEMWASNISLPGACVIKKKLEQLKKVS